MASQATDRLTNLPIEQLTAVLSYLPPREIARFHRVSKFSKQRVDENEPQLARPHLHHHHARIQAALADLCGLTLDMLETFVRCMA